MAKAISWAKNTPDRAPNEYQACGRDNVLGQQWCANVYPAYQRQLAASNAADFDDLLLHVATILRDNPEVRASLDQHYRFILVDEYQDTNLAQYAIARALSIDYPNLAVTGDPGPIDLRLAGGEPEQHLGVRARLSGGPRRPAGAELPQHAADPAGGRRTDRP